MEDNQEWRPLRTVCPDAQIVLVLIASAVGIWIWHIVALGYVGYWAEKKAWAEQDAWQAQKKAQQMQTAGTSPASPK